MSDHTHTSAAIIGAPYPKPGVHCAKAQKAYDRAAEAVQRLKNGSEARADQ